MTQNAIKKAFVNAYITPYKSGAWKQYVESCFMSRAAPQACSILHQVLQLQDETAISATSSRRRACVCVCVCVCGAPGQAVVLQIPQAPGCGNSYPTVSFGLFFIPSLTTDVYTTVALLPS